MTIIEIDGQKYNVIDSELRRSFKILDDQNSGRTLDGGMHRSIIGTYYNYSWRLIPKDVEDYDTLYEILSAPVDSRIITVPYGQTTKTFEAYITQGEDTLERIENGVSYWSGMTIQFVAMEPDKRPT